jgi:endonuclease/exonuclease/phosphatase family metal-dependent hydrolase
MWLLTLTLCWNAKGQDTLTIVYYNILNYHIDKLEHFKTIIDYTKADVIVLNEVSSNAASTSLLNSINELQRFNYQKARFTDGPDKDNMLFYNSGKLVLHFQDSIPTELRLINRYQLFHKMHSEDTVFLDFYSCHLKSSSGATNANQRFRELKNFKDYVDNLPIPQNIFIGGDFNFYNFATEPACQYLVDSGEVKFFDPIESLGNWHDNPLYAQIHTQSTRVAAFGGGATGGLDDRFDFIFVSEDIIQGQNDVTYVAGSYLALGNDGLRLNQSLIATPLSATVPEEVTNAMYYMSDHLPVVMKIAVNIKNPVSVTDILTESSELINIEIYSLMGQLVYRGAIGSVPKLPHQIHIIRYNYTDKSEIRKEIIF